MRLLDMSFPSEIFYRSRNVLTPEFGIRKAGKLNWLDAAECCGHGRRVDWA